jgi:hypothetical protein
MTTLTSTLEFVFNITGFKALFSPAYSSMQREKLLNLALAMQNLSAFQHILISIFFYRWTLKQTIKTIFALQKDYTASTLLKHHLKLGKKWNVIIFVCYTYELQLYCFYFKTH